MSIGLPVVACNRYYGIGLVVVEQVCVKTEKQGYTCFVNRTGNKLVITNIDLVKD